MGQKPLKLWRGRVVIVLIFVSEFITYLYFHFNIETTGSKVKNPQKCSYTNGSQPLYIPYEML